MIAKKEEKIKILCALVTGFGILWTTLLAGFLTPLFLILGFSGYYWYHSVTTFHEIVSSFYQVSLYGDNVSNRGVYSIIEPAYAIPALIVIPILWVSLPVMIRVTKGLEIKKRIFYIYLFSTQFPLSLHAIASIFNTTGLSYL